MLTLIGLDTNDAKKKKKKKYEQCKAAQGFSADWSLLGVPVGRLNAPSASPLTHFKVKTHSGLTWT